MQKSAKIPLELRAICDYFNRVNNTVEKSANSPWEAKKTVKKASTAELPMVDLGSVLEFVEKIESRGLQTLTNQEVARKMGFAAPTSTPFYRSMTSAKLFGLLDTTQGVNLTKLALDYFKPTDEESKRASLMAALRSVVGYQKFLDRYMGKRLPHSEIVGNLIEREFNLTAGAAETCANVFLSSVRKAGCVQPDGTLSGVTHQPAPAPQTTERADPLASARPTGAELPTSEDSESHFLTLDARQHRRVVLQGPPVITVSELKRIQSWLAVQFHVVDSLDGAEPAVPKPVSAEPNNTSDT